MSSLTQTVVNQTKLDRLTSAAQGGKAGLDEFDANQRSIAGERAQMAAGLAADAASADYHGPAVGGAPSILSGQLNAGLNPYSTALAGARTAFQQNLGSQSVASLRYLDAVRAAEAPAIAAARKGSGGGRGGGSGGSGGTAKPLTDTELTKALLNAAATEQQRHVAAIHQSELQAAQGEQIAQRNATSTPTGPALPAGVRLDLPSERVPYVTPHTPASEGIAGNNPQLEQVLAERAQRIARSQFDSKKQAQAAANILNVRVARQQRVEGSSLLPIAEQIAQDTGNPTIAQRSSYLLTPSAEATYRRGIAAGLPKLPSVTTPKPRVVPFETAARTSGAPPGDVPAFLKISYGYTDSKGQAQTGGLVNDVIAQAKRAASAGYDEASFQQLLEQNAPGLAKGLRAHPRAAAFAGAVISGLWPTTPTPVETNPYVRYYNRLYPPVALR